MRLCHSLLAVPFVCFAQAPAPVISFEKNHHDFGKISNDQKVSYRYRVTNSGSAPLQIKEIRPSCGCSYTVVGQWYLKPSEDTFIEVRFDPTGMMGNIHKSLEVLSDDPANPKVTLTFEASVTQEIMPSTKVLFLDKISRKGTATKTIRLQSGNGQPVVVTDAKIPGAPFLSCVPQKEGNDVILSVTVNGALLPKQKLHGAEVMTVRTTNKRASVLEFHIQWEIEAAVVAEPSRVSWHDLAGKELKRTIRLNSLSGVPFKITDTKSTSALITVTGLSKDSAQGQSFEIILSSKAKAGGYHETLTLTLDHPEQPILEIGVAAVLK